MNNYLNIRRKKTLLNNIYVEKPIGLVLILNRNWLFHDAIEGQMTVMKGVARRRRRRRRRTQLLDDLRNKRYCELKEEAEDRKRWRRQFINRTKVSSANKQHT